VKFAGANFSLVEAQGLTCKQVNFNQVNFSCADLTNASFDNKVSYVGAQWLSTMLTGLKTTNEVVTDIKKKQENEEKRTTEIRNKLLELEKDFRQLEQEVSNKHQQVVTNLSQVDVSLKAHTDTLTQLAIDMSQTQLNHAALKLYTEEKISALTETMTRLDENDKAFGQKAKQDISVLQVFAANLTISISKQADLLQALEFKSQQASELTATQLSELKVELTHQQETLKQRIDGEVSGIKHKLSILEQEVFQMKKQINSEHQQRQNISLTISSDNFVAPGAKLKFGKVNADVYTLPSNPTPEDYKIADRLTQANLTKRIDVGNHYSSEAEIERDDINARLVARESNVISSGSTATQSLFTPSRSTAPATLPQKKLLKEVRELLDKDYPEADAKEDEEIRVHREEVLATLNRLQGHKLNQQEEAKLIELLNRLRGEIAVEKKDERQMESSMSS